MLPPVTLVHTWVIIIIIADLVTTTNLACDMPRARSA